jgi:hypothetical protein
MDLGAALRDPLLDDLAGGEEQVRWTADVAIVRDGEVLTAVYRDRIPPRTTHPLASTPSFPS